MCHQSQASKDEGRRELGRFPAALDDGEGATERVELLDVPANMLNRERLIFEGNEMSESDAMLKSKGALKAWERIKARL